MKITTTQSDDQWYGGLSRKNKPVDREGWSFAEVMSSLSKDTITENARAEGSPQEQFSAYLDKTPAQHIRDQVLAEMGLTEADFKALPADAQKGVMEKVAERLEEYMARQEEEGREIGFSV